MAHSGGRTVPGVEGIFAMFTLISPQRACLSERKRWRGLC